MRRLLLLLLVVAAALYYAYRYAMDSPWRISVAEARSQLMSGKIDMVLDVRTAAERDVLGVYPNAVAIPSSELTQRMPVLHPDKSQWILIYCNTGQRARRAAEILHDLGYTHAYYITTPYTQLL